MANLKLMPDPVDLREVTFTNIILLGFDVESSEAQYRIPFTRDMFAVPNRKAMEVIFHFLFTKLNNDSSKETFRNCWPIVDKRKEQEFRKICIEWLNKIKKDDGDCRLPNIVPSLLLSPTGDRFYQFLFYFSTYVLKQRISRIPAKHGKLPVWPKLSSVNRKYVLEINRSQIISTINTKSKLVHYMETVAHTKEEWVKFSRELSKEHRKLTKQRRECEQKLKELRTTREEILGKSTISAKDAVKRTQNLQKITEFWKTITKLFEAEKVVKEQLEDILNSNDKKRVLDGEKIHFKVPDILLRECERQLQSGKRYQNLYEDGNVNLVSLVQLWNLSLHLIKESYSQYPLPDVEHDEAYVRSEAHNHANSLKKTVSLSKNLAGKTLPDLKMSIEELKEKIGENNSNSNSMKSSALNKIFNLDFLPATPPVQFHPTTTTTSANRDVNSTNRKQYVETPDAVNVLLHQLKKNTAVNMDHQDDTPVRGLTKKRIPPSTLKKSKVKQPASEKKQFQPNREVRQPASEKKHFQLNKENAHPPISSTTMTATTKSRIPKPKVAKVLNEEQVKRINPPYVTPKVDGRKEQQKPLNTRAQQLLIDQIAQSVLDKSQHEEEILSSSDSEENEASKIHAFDDPMEAFTTEAFESRDKVPRTPSSKKSKQRREENYSSIVIEEELLSESPLGSFKSNENENATVHSLSPELTPEKEDNDGRDIKHVDDSFDLKALQERIRRIQIREDKVCTELDTETGVNANKTIEESIHEHEFLTPVLSGVPQQACKSPAYNPITPLRFSDDDEDTNGFSPVSVTPTKLSDVDFTPIKTPWRKDQKNVNFDLSEHKPTKASENAERNSEASFEFRERTVRGVDSPPKDKSRLNLFLENNKELLNAKSTDVTPKNGHTYPNKNFDSFHTPTNQPPQFNEFMKNNLINFITPFKSPDSPSATSHHTPMNISAKEVDDFIDEVISSTSKTPKAFASLMKLGKTPKTPGLFGMEEPTFDNNYTLMTPGMEITRPYRLDFSDDDDDEL